MENNNNTNQQNNNKNNQPSQKKGDPQKSWYTLPWVWVIVAVVVIALLLSLGKHKKTARSEEESAQPTADTSSMLSTTTPTTMDSYDQMLRMYTGKLLLLSTDEKGVCMSAPSTATFAKGTKILVANNGTTSPIVEGMNRTLQFRPYSYRTVTLTETGLFTVTCNKLPVATVTVQ